ncbi:MAG: hypothetical protein R3219_01390 [Hydrogenovibrio sp.]|nr:hypothetical protein [Hydrogenovibrio sp.]
MIYMQIEPNQADAFQKKMTDSGWDLVSQEGGQSHFIGWAYIMHWQKQLEDREANVWFHFSENQGVPASHLEMNPAAKPAMEQLLAQLTDDE